MLWFPSFFQLRFQRNPSRLNSLWLGWGYPILAMPEIVFFNFVVPLRNGSLPMWKMLPLRLWATVVLYFKLFVLGAHGSVAAENITLEEMAKRLEDVVNIAIKMSDDQPKDD